MKTNALSVANYFIDLSLKDNRPMQLLGLVKRVYIAHGFALALLDCGLLDPRFDKVEAWKYGPVVPSVYHSFKWHRDGEIKEKTVLMECDEQGKAIFPTPTLEDEEAKMVVEMVWKRYRLFSSYDLVSLTHQKGTPWAVCYAEGKNKEIPDYITGFYYKRLVNEILANGNKK